MITKLPEFAFLHGYGENDELYPRNVILHIKTRTILEIFEEDYKDFEDEDDLTLEFSINHHINGKRNRNKYVMVLHSSPFFDKKREEDYLLNEIMLPAFRWFSDYCNFMDNLIAKNGIDF